jgi:hypothetical protein
MIFSFFPLRVSQITGLVVFIFCLFCQNYISGQDEQGKGKKGEDEGNVSDFYGVFKIQNWDGDLKRPEVKDDAKNVLREKLQDGESTNEKVEGIASNISLEEKIIWKPAWRYDDAGGVRLPAIASSDDWSLLAVVERTGEKPGPNGSRIIILRTIDWKILRVYELKEKKISLIVFIPGETQLLCFSQKQASLKMPSELFVLDIDGGKVLRGQKIRRDINSMQVFENPVTAIFSAAPDKDNAVPVFSLDIEHFQINKQYNSENSTGLLFKNPTDKNRFIFAGNKSIEIFEPSLQKPVAKFANPEDGTPVNAVFIGDSDVFCVLYRSGGAYLFKEGQARQLLPNSELILLYNDLSKTFLLEEIKKNEMVVFSAKDSQECDSFSASSLRPKTTGNIIYCGRLSENGYFFVDNHGNIFTCVKGGKKWKKSLIIEAMK